MKTRSALFLTLLLTFVAILTACGEKARTKETDVRVMLAAGEGCTVVSEPVLEVGRGGSASFSVAFEDGFIFSSADAGTFDPATNTLTLDGVSRPTFITLYTERTGYDPNVVVRYTFRGTQGTDTTSVESGTQVHLGTEITVTAGETEDAFTGWSFERGGAIVSGDRSFTFRVLPDYVKDEVIQVYPNYAKLNVFYYDANGGKINGSTANAKGNEYAKTKLDSGAQRLQVTLTDSYLSYCTCPSAFWNDGTFTREGYVLKEYNTKPDGSGLALSPGAKFYQVNPEGGDYVLYCIWAKCEESQFTVESYAMPLSSKIKVANAPQWISSGVIVTGYSGNDESVVIPETIGGQKVIAIKTGAFRGKSFRELLLPRTMQEVQKGAVTDCSSLETLYFPCGIWSIPNDAFDAATYENFRTLVVYANVAPRYSTAEYGAYAVKISRLLASNDRNRIVVISGSSSLQGLATKYLEDLLDNRYTVVNFGTTRTTHGSLYLEAMGHYTHPGDTVLFAPENSVYMMGDTELYWKTIRDMESLYDLFRYVDISHYSNVFGAFTDHNQNYLYTRAPQNYEQIVRYAGSVNKYGDDIKKNKDGYVNTSSTKYNDCYYITLNERFKSTGEGNWSTSGNQTDMANAQYWISIDEGPVKEQIIRSADAAKAGGAKVLFTFCPCAAGDVADFARTAEWMAAYDALLRDGFSYDGILGSCRNYVFDTQYFFDCAFHTNNYGRTWRTYTMYKDLCALFGLEIKYKNGDLGTNYQGCLFEKDAAGNVLTEPKYPVDWMAGWTK